MKMAITMRTDDVIAQLLDEYNFNYKRVSSVFSMKLMLDDVFKNKREFVLTIDATRKNKIILESYIDDNKRVLDENHLMRNLNLLNSKSTIGKFYIDSDDKLKYVVSFEFNRLGNLFNYNEARRQLITSGIERVVSFFDNNYNSFKDLPHYTESIPDFTFGN